MGEALLSQLALYSARPTLRVDGQDDARTSANLQSLTMQEQEGGLSSLEVSFGGVGLRDDGQVGFLFEDEQLIKFGARIEVYAGEAAAPTAIFDGLVSAIELAMDAEGPPRVVAWAEDKLAKARLERRSASYENQSLADLVGTVASRHGLTPKVTGLSEPLPLAVQFNESDLAFLRRLLQRVGADLQVVGDELQAGARAEVTRSSLTLVMHSQLSRLRVVADLANQVTALKVTGFDPEQGQAVEGSGSGAALGPGSGRTGASVLEQTFGARSQQTSHRLALTSAEATALAEAEFAQRARRFVRVEGVCEGNPALRVGTEVTLKDVSPRFDNAYSVVACTHRFDVRRGYETSFIAEGAYLGEAA
jgi:uncharacterized protein